MRIAATTGLLFVLLASVLSVSNYGRARTQSQDSGFPITISTKFDTATDHLLIRTVVNDVPLWCGLDTGFSALMAVDRMKAATAHLLESAGRPTPDGNAPFRGDGSAVAMVDV